LNQFNQQDRLGRVGNSVRTSSGTTAHLIAISIAVWAHATGKSEKAGQ
jgi:hypothetical protein